MLNSSKLILTCDLSINKNFKTLIFFLVLCLFSIAFSKEFHSSSFLQTRLGKTRMRSTLGSSARTNLTLNTQTKVHTSTSTTYVGSRTGTGFACFLLGLILFPLSICWIFYNERSAVKDTYFTDILDKSNVKEYNPNTIGSEFIDNQLHIYRGTINIFDTAKIGNIDFEDHIKRIANLNDNTLNHNVNAKTPGHQSFAAANRRATSAQFTRFQNAPI